MKNLRPALTTAALATLLALGIQQTEFSGFASNIAVADTIKTAIRQDSIAISTADYDKTVKWYRDNLNAVIEEEWTVSELPNVKLANLNVHGQRIDIVGSTESSTEISQMVNTNEYLGNINFFGLVSFQVNNVDGVINELAAKGVPVLIEVADYPSVERRIGFIEDNNGNLIELSQPIDRQKYTDLI